MPIKRGIYELHIKTFDIFIISEMLLVFILKKSKLYVTSHILYTSVHRGNRDKQMSRI